MRDWNWPSILAILAVAGVLWLVYQVMLEALL